MNTVYFIKRFDTGILKGISVPVSLTLDRTFDRLAKDFRIGRRGSDCITKDRWTITDMSFQNFNR